MTPGGIFGGGGLAGSGSSMADPGCHGTAYLAPVTASVLLHQQIVRSAGPEPVRRVRDMMMPMAGMGGGGMGTLQALLTELSGLKKPRGFLNRVVRRVLGFQPKAPPKYRILVMMATNMPQALDEALLRPGRIDRIYKVGYPSMIGRRRTYEGYLQKVDHELTPTEIDKLATKVQQKGFTLIPLSLYFKGHVVKVELALVTHKKQHDKRQVKKEADDKREMDRAIKRAR